MISWCNLGVLIAASLLALHFYIRSVGPAALEKKIGPKAYEKCGHYRTISMVFMIVMVLSFVVYRFHPLPVPLPKNFPWDWWISGVIALSIGVPSTYLMLRGVKDAGEESMRPRKEHTLYGGIYQKVRHPQAAGELPLWWAIAFFLHAPFLAVFSLLYIPFWIAMCLAEEKDLLLRYGDAYAHYREQTGFWVPKLVPKNKRTNSEKEAESNSENGAD
jgi:protein-S-isoprenylcysteine O-methyltransferase Ste14